MVSRKEKYKKENISKKAKFLIGSLFLSVGVGSSVNIVFADQDIQSMLKNWFDNQRTASIDQIETAVMTEKETQLQRLKEELQLEIANAEKQLSEFTETEKDKRVKAIQDYADKLIQNIAIDNIGEQTKVTNELDNILSDAISKMDNVSKEASPKEDTEKTVKDPSSTIEESTKDKSGSTEEPVEEPSQATEEPIKDKPESTEEPAKKDDE
jgi:hypothetical protein